MKTPKKKTAKKKATMRSAKAPRKPRPLSRKAAAKKVTAPVGAPEMEAEMVPSFPLEDVIHRLLEIFKSDSTNWPSTSPLPSEVEKFRQKVFQTWNYVPTVCIVGQTGAGKSTLCNTLFGSHRFEVSAVEACTKLKQELVVQFGGKSKMMLVDMPGVGESDEADEAHAELYRKVLPKSDIVLWVLKADSRSYAADKRFWPKIRVDVDKSGIPVLFLLSQADKIDPIREWDFEKNLPGPHQMGNLLAKRSSIAGEFNLNSHQVLFVSAETGYCIQDLVFRIILALPDGKKLPFLDKVEPDARSKKSIAEAKRGFFSDAIKWVKENTVDLGKFLWDNREHLIDVFNIGKQVFEIFQPPPKKPGKRRKV